MRYRSGVATATGWARTGLTALLAVHGGCVFMPADGSTVGGASTGEGSPSLHTFMLGGLWPSSDAVKIVPLNYGGSTSTVGPIPGAEFAPEWLSESVNSNLTIGGQPIYGRVGEFDLTRLRWSPSPTSFGDDGRDWAMFAIQSGNLNDGMYLSGTQGFFECLFDNAAASPETVVLERCRFGRTLNTSYAPFGPPVKLWRARSLNEVPAERQATFKRWTAPADGGAAVFTHHLVSRTCSTDAITGTDSLGPVVIGEEIRFMTPIGQPSTGETKPHSYVKNTVDGVVSDPNQFSEALGFDCPRVLADLPTFGAGEAVRRHGALAVQRCVALRNCGTPTPPATPGVCDGVVPAHVTPDPSWVPRNRLYLGAPGTMVPINVARYLEPRPGYAGVNGLEADAAEWTTFRIVLRFGAGQMMMLDHLAHVRAVDASTVPVGQGTEGMGIANGPLLEPGQAIGFIYRIEPWIRRRTDQGATPRLPIVGDGFDWTVYDLLGTANQFANQARYEESNGAIPQFGVSTNQLFGRCPIDHFGAGLGDLYRERMGTSRTSDREPGTPCQYAIDDFYPNAGRILRDRPGTLAGNWFKAGVDANGDPLRGSPALALSSSGPLDAMGNPSALVGIDVSFRDPAPEQGPESRMQFRVCSTVGETMPSSMMNSRCMDVGLAFSNHRPELITSGGASSVCYESGETSLPSRWHARFILTRPVPTDPDTLVVFRGRGSCPTESSELASQTQLIRDGQLEFSREDFVR